MNAETGGGLTAEERVGRLTDWRNAIRHALHERDVQAVPHLLALMALDGYPDEAERLRQAMLDITQEIP
jgi:hypothetical protein